MPPVDPSAPVRLALIGAGVFARDAYVPSLLRHPDTFRIAAIYSRNLANAQALAQQIPYPVAVSDDLPTLLAQPEIEAVAVLLPIPAMPDVIRQALAAGKHVLSEKPIAPTLAEGQSLLAYYERHPGQVWMVGENWRYEEAFCRAAEVVHSGALGEVLTCHWPIFIPINERNKYYQTTWRRDRSVPGGFALDTGVHHVAVLRMVLGEVAEVSAHARHASPDLPPVDTVTATLRFEGGALGVYVASYAAGAPWPPTLHVVGAQGALRVQRRELEITRDGETERIECSGFDGVEKELLAFARAIRHGELHLNSPVEALQDLAVMEAILDSAASGRPVTPVRVL